MTAFRNHFEETSALLAERDAIEERCRNASADGLANSIATHMDQLPPEVRVFVWAYVKELHRRAEIADRPGFLRGHPQKDTAA